MKTLSLLFLLLAAGAAGCGGADDGLKRVEVSGRVTRDSQPLPGGAISFVPGSAVKGPAANAAIENGRYQISRSDGPVAGTYQVIVSSSPAKDELMKAQSAGQIPQTKWEFSITIPDQSELEYDLELNASKESRLP